MCFLNTEKWAWQYADCSVYNVDDRNVSCAQFVIQIFTLALLFVKNVDVVIQKHKLRFTNVYNV